MNATRRHWLQWSLRTWLIAILAVCLIVGYALRDAQVRHNLVRQCEARGWRVYYEYECNEQGVPTANFDRATNQVTYLAPHGPELLRRILGDAYFNRIRGLSATLDDDDDHRLFAKVNSQPSITFLKIDGTFGTEDLEATATLPNLRHLSVELAALTPKEIRSIDPECDVYIRIMQRQASR